MVAVLETTVVLESVNMNHQIVRQFVFVMMMLKMKEETDMA